MHALSPRRLAVFATTTVTLLAGGIATAGGPDADLATDGEITAAALDGVRPAQLPSPLGQEPAPPELAPRAAATPDRADRDVEPEVVRTWSGIASWYGPGFAGRRTANGEIFQPSALTAAHKTLPFGSQVRVTFPPTGRSTVVRINDRGPFVAGREIDLSSAAAAAIGLRSRGHGRVVLELLP